MTQIVYTGRSDFRTLTPQDFPDASMGWEEDVEEIRWTPGSRNEVPEPIAKYLLEYHTHEFAPFEDPKNRDHRTKDELLAEATELDISGRSKMTKEELRDAIYERRAEVEASEEGSEDVSVASVEAQEHDPTEGGVPFEGQSVNESIGDPQGTPGTVQEV